MPRANSAKRRVRQLLIVSAVVTASMALSGCAGKVGGDFKNAAHADVAQQSHNTLRGMTASWTSTPGIQTLRHRHGDGITIHGPVDIPEHIGTKTLDLSFPGPVSISELAETLALEGVNLIPLGYDAGAVDAVSPAPVAVGNPDEQILAAIQGGAPSSVTTGLGQGVGAKRFRLPRFQGTVQELLEVVSLMTDVSFKGAGAFILARPGIEYYVDLPQDELLVNRVARDLAALGATNVVTSIDAGSVTFNAGASRDRVLRDYMKRLERNNAMIGLQVAVVSVSHDRDRNVGVDWSSLQATLGGASIGSENGANGNGTGAPAVGESPSAGVAAAASAVNRVSGTMTGSNLSLAYLGGDFELRGLVNMLSRYGTTETKQNLVLRTLSANPVRIRSGQSTPYISEINVSSTGDSVTGGTETDVAETGLTLNITPYYNDKTGLVTMNVDLEMSSIIAFINLSAGNQLGQLTQPDIQEQSFSNAARLSAGETVILGGITYDQVSVDGNTLSPLEALSVDGEQYSRQQNSLFVVLRPTVTIYE